MVTIIRVDELSIVGGNLALDFVNSRSGPPGGAPDVDALGSYGDLLTWAQRVAVLRADEADNLRRRALDDPAGAARSFARALGLRDSLFDTFAALAANLPPPAAALRRLRDDEAESLGHADLVGAADGMAWTWPSVGALDRPWWPVAHAAVDLLTGGSLERIKACGGCRFLFLDETKNGSRRWCSMAECGTRAKSRRFVARRAAARGGARSAGAD
jgi:predicted RNA-binding Zn ribbon-like protein